MPLSEREKRIFDEIERQLGVEDPAFARDAHKGSTRMDEMRRLRWGATSFLAGFVILIGFFVSGWLIAGVAAFAAMVAGIVLVAGSLRDIASTRRSGQGPRERVARVLEGWEQRMRQRYKRP